MLAQMIELTRTLLIDRPSLLLLRAPVKKPLEINFPVFLFIASHANDEASRFL